MNIAKLFARIGLQTDEDKAKSFQASMNRLRFTMKAATFIAGGYSLALKKIAGDALAAATAFKQFETETGASAQELQKWQAVAEQTNQTAESVTSAVKAIALNIERIKLGKGDISGFQLLGIDPTGKDPFEILEEIRVKSRGLTSAMKKDILSQMGVGAGLLQTLNLTRKEFDEMAGRAWIISPQAIETLNQTKSAVDLTTRAMGYMKAQIAVGLSPQIRKAAKDFQEFMKVNEKAIIEGFKAGFKYVEMFVRAVGNAVAMIHKIVTSTVGWEIVIKGLIGAFIALNSVLLLSPIGMIAAGFILLVAVLDDLYTYSKGGKSLFGQFMKEFPELEKSLKGFFTILKKAYDLYKTFTSGEELSIKRILDEWGLLGKAIGFVYDKLKAAGEFAQKRDIKMPSALDLIPGARLMESAVKAITQTNEINVNVYGSSDPIATGDAAAKSMQKSINAASAQLPRDQ